MAIIRLGKENFDNSSLTTYVSRSFEWTSERGIVSGAIPVYVERSATEKSTDVTYGTEGPAGSSPVTNIFEAAKQLFVAKKEAEGDTPSKTNLTEEVLFYWDVIGKAPISERKHQYKILTRNISTPLTSISSSFKLNARNVTFKDYKVPYPDIQWAYNNYNCLNFFTASNAPSDSVLIYPAPTRSVDGDPTKQATRFDAPYRPQRDKFGFSFWINPRYNTLDGITSSKRGEFHAGTIMHMSSCYAVSLVTGSSVDVRNNPDGYRILLQLSQSATIPPSSVNITIANDDRPAESPEQALVFLSSDNSLKFNHWHHVALTWGGKNVNAGTGSFYIDGKKDASFVVTQSNVILPTLETIPDPHGAKSHLRNPDALFVGNFYEGGNRGSDNSEISRFFNTTVATREGLSPDPDTNYTTDPSNVSLQHPLNAEVHEVRIYKKHLSSDDIKDAYANGPRAVVTQSHDAPAELSSATNPELMFYLPPFFVKDSRSRKILEDPFNYTDGYEKTINPINSRMSSITNIHDINLENFVREFVRGEWPRLYKLQTPKRSPAVVAPDGEGFDKSTLSFILGGDTAANGKIVNKRNLTVLPCDNGLFRPNFVLLLTGTYSPPASKYDPIYNSTLLLTPRSGTALDKYTNGLGHMDLSYINLSDFVYLNPNYQATVSAELEAIDLVGGMASTVAKSMYNVLHGVTPFYMGTVENGGLASVNKDIWPAIPSQTADTSSPSCVFFNIPNLFYGDRIKPGSFKVRGTLGTTKLTSTAKWINTLEITLRDNEKGGLYRADSATPPAVWNCVGSLLYNEGAPVVLSPHLKDFARRGFHTFFQGERNIHILEIMVPCNKGMINSSSNPTYRKLAPTDYANETAKDFVYITGLNFHDDNLNILARTNLAQPAVKRDNDHYMFRVKIDF